MYTFLFSTAGAPPTNADELMWILLLTLVGAATLVVLAITMYLLVLMKRVLDPKPAPTEAAVPEMSFWQRWFTGLRPLTQEKDLMMDHTYDGIVELKNPSPPWFMYLFYGTIGFGVVYLILFHVVNVNPLQEAEYTEEVAVAEAQRAAYIKLVAGKINEDNVAVLTDAKALGDGKTLYLQYCVACHGQQGEGGVGPNLTDAYWLHGGSVKNIFHTITEGIPEKGMLSWKKQLNPLQVQQVTSYLLSLQGTNPPGAKAPQGEKQLSDKVAANL